MLSMTGCAWTRPQPIAQPTQPLPEEIAAYYAYPAKPTQATMEPAASGHERPRHREWLVRFPLSADFEPTEPVVELEWFESRAPGQRPAIVFNPILGGDYPLERGICRFLADRGYHVAMIHRKTLKIGPDQPVERLELMLRQGVIRIRQVVDWMESQPGVDAHRLGSYGISMGGMASVMAAAVEPRLRAHMVALAGGSIPDILMSSKDSLLVKPRQRYLTHNHLDLKGMSRRLEAHIVTDPVKLAPYVEPRKIFMVVSLLDRTVGTANELRLREALRRPRTVYLLAGHYTAYLFLPYLKHASLRFFNTQL